MFGKDMVEIILEGDTYDDAYKMALDYLQCESFILHPSVR